MAPTDTSHRADTQDNSTTQHHSRRHDEVQRGEMLPGARRMAIARQAEAVGEVTVSRLSETFAVSADTIRRDLDQLAHEGVLTRTRGGAVTARTAAVGPDVGRGLDERRAIRATAKNHIARLAASLVHDGDAVILNGGTTTLAAASHLAGRQGLVIVTNNLRIPSEVPASAVRDMYVLGGAVHLAGQNTTGPVEIRSSRPGWVLEVHADIALIGVGAVSTGRGCTVSNVQEAATIAEMVARSSRTAVLADSSKIGRDLVATVCDLEAVDYLVTETNPPEDISGVLEDHGVQIIF